MKTRWFLICAGLTVICMRMVACNVLPKPKITLVACAETYVNFVPVNSYSFDESKCKVINVFGSLSSIDFVLSKTPTDKINQIIENNPDFEFIFYLGGVDLSDSVAIREKLIKYNMSYPIMIDHDREFAVANNLSLPNLTIGYITDQKNRIFGTSVIGTRQSFFDSEFEQAKRKLGK